MKICAWWCQKGIGFHDSWHYWQFTWTLGDKDNLKGPTGHQHRLFVWCPGIGESFQHIKDGRADMMVCGGSEAALHPLAMMGFASMQALCSTHNEDPKAASDPLIKKEVALSWARAPVLSFWKH